MNSNIKPLLTKGSQTNSTTATYLTIHAFVFVGPTKKNFSTNILKKETS